jgi:hypothetical protein
MGKEVPPHNQPRLQSSLKKRDEKAAEKAGNRGVRIDTSKNQVFKLYPPVEDHERDEVLEGYSKLVTNDHYSRNTIDEIDARRVNETDW